MKCMVKDCKFSSNHVTIEHICTTCYTNGHGKHECGNTIMCEELKKYYNDIVTNPCTNNYCENTKTHTNDGHKCIFCNKYGSNHMKKCPENGTVIVDKYINSDIITKSEFLKPGEYYEIYNGMECYTFVRRNIDTNILESIFMHKNNWNQNNDDTSDAPRYKAFIYRYNLYRKVFL